MPNPSRPQYKEIIESTWGLAVADHVTRRYGSAAERDADLGGFTAADLAGQVVVIAGGGGTFLQVHNGQNWITVTEIPAPGAGPLLECSGYFSGHVAGAYGAITITFPGRLGQPGQRPSVLIQIDQAEGYSPAALSAFGVTNLLTDTGFAVNFINYAGGYLANGAPVAFSWYARATTVAAPPAGMSRPALDEASS